MSKITDAQEILRELGLPRPQQNEIAALTFLALCGIGPSTKWSVASRESLTISKGLMSFIKSEYGRTYAPNTRETFRRQVLHQFVQAQVADYNPDNPSLPTNHPKSHYAVSEAALSVAKSFGTKRWKQACQHFRTQKGRLSELYSKERKLRLVPVLLPDGITVELSPGKHNRVQADVVEKFAPRFAPGASLLYLGDTSKKNFILDTKSLTLLGIPMNQHDKLPDVVLDDRSRKWLFLVEAVTSHGPMSPKRVIELNRMFGECGRGLVFVSAFPDFAEFRKHLKNIAWETEVWIAEIPDHLIHYNGDRFLGPH